MHLVCRQLNTVAFHAYDFILITTMTSKMRFSKVYTYILVIVILSMGSE